VDPSQNPAFAHLLTAEVESLIPSWAILDALAHLTSTFAWEKWVVLGHI
jgi:hypothetical protein